ncbi:MAG TPA: M1 family aminopeptidase [Candidatus Baltobacteraceae bacterium]
MKSSVRVCATAALLLTFASAAIAAPPKTHPRPYGRGKAFYHKTEVAPYRFAGTKLAVSFDFARGVVRGTATETIYPKTDGLQTIRLDSQGLRYSAVTVNGVPAKYRVRNDSLYVDLARPAKATDKLTIVATYSATPTRGLYFIRPDKYYPHMQPEIWSQGEQEDNRRWFPTWDEPNDKTPVEQVITVQKGWTVTANGHLRSHTTDGATTTWDWIEPAPISTYLIAFTAGPYVKFHTQTGDTPVDYFVSQADAKWAPLCFGRTKDMVAYFQKIIGVHYPWEKYDQTTVERFTAGGMENASATTQTEFAIHPPQYDLEQPCDGLVSHELAHQWWGDDVTTPDWANIWINEGYATYFADLWAEHHFGEARFQYQRYNEQQDYFGETKRYWRPIVDYVYASSGDSFDASGYPRPGAVLHMLRYMEGDARFFKALHDYLLAYQHKNADTHQFFEAIDASLGTNLSWFENEWFFRSAYPHFFIKQHYDAAAKSLTLDVTQKSHDGRPFRMPVDIAVYMGSHEKTTRFVADALHQNVRITGVTAKPSMVLFDPNDNILRKLDYAKSVDDLGYQALHAPYVGDRLWALDQLGNQKKGNRAKARAYVRQAVTGDSFYGVRADALDAAASLDDAQTVRAALHDKDPRVVIAAGQEVENLDNAKDASLASDLESLARSSNPLIAGAALRGLGATKARGAYSLLIAGLDRHSFREPIARGALAGLASYGNRKAIPLIEAHAAYGIDESERPDAIAALGKIAKSHPGLVLGYLTRIAQHDRYYRARGAAVRAIGKLGDPAAIAALQQIEKSDTEESVQNAAWDAIHDIQDNAKAKKTKRKPPSP